MAGVRNSASEHRLHSTRHLQLWPLEVSCVCLLVVEVSTYMVLQLLLVLYVAQNNVCTLMSVPTIQLALTSMFSLLASPCLLSPSNALIVNPFLLLSSMLIYFPYTLIVSLPSCPRLWHYSTGWYSHNK